MKHLLRDSHRDLRRHWKPLFLTDLLFKIIAVVVLTPLVAIAFRSFLSFSGNGLLADVDVAYFLLTPVGLAALIVVGALWLGIIALELATLMGVLACEPDRKSVVLSSLRFALFKAWAVCQVAGRVIARALLLAAPFLVVAGLVYMSLLSEFDINYYLQERPPVFKLALGIGGLLAAGLAGVLIYATSGWLIALGVIRGSAAIGSLESQSRTNARFTVVLIARDCESAFRFIVGKDLS